jgi:geranylgeranyl diphosphate synthase, type II
MVIRYLGMTHLSQDVIDFSGANTRVRRAVETFLEGAFEARPLTVVREAARYAVLGGGRRWRAITTVASGQIFRPDALEVTLPSACSIELAHAASLVLDDLPSMDNAEVRRGKPCTHLAFPAWAVDLTPIFLVTMAYELTLDNRGSSDEGRRQSTMELFRTGQQMIVGQSKDILQPKTCDQEEQRLLECYHLKTGVLYATAAKIGAILCGATEAEAQSVYTAGLSLGLSFQLLDDVADTIAGVPELGKQSGMDFGKWTSIDWLGVDGAVNKSQEYRSKALCVLQQFGSEADWFRRLIYDATTPLTALGHSRCENRAAEAGSMAKFR